MKDRGGRATSKDHQFVQYAPVRAGAPPTGNGLHSRGSDLRSLIPPVSQADLHNCNEDGDFFVGVALSLASAPGRRRLREALVRSLFAPRKWRVRKKRLFCFLFLVSSSLRLLGFEDHVGSLGVFLKGASRGDHSGSSLVLVEPAVSGELVGWAEWEWAEWIANRVQYELEWDEGYKPYCYFEWTLGPWKRWQQLGFGGGAAGTPAAASSQINQRKVHPLLGAGRSGPRAPAEAEQEGGGESFSVFREDRRSSPEVRFSDFQTEKIPRVVHKVLILLDQPDIRVQELPDRLRAAMKSWEGDRNPGYQVRFWNENAVRAFIERDWGPELLDTYDTLIPPTWKADLARYAIIARLGGWYADMQTVLLKPLDKVLASVTSSSEEAARAAVFFCERPSYSLATTVFRAPRGHPWPTRAVEKVRRNVEKRFYGGDPLGPTGPLALGWGARSDGCCSFPIDALRPGFERDPAPDDESKDRTSEQEDTSASSSSYEPPAMSDLPKIGFFVSHEDISGFSFLSAKGAVPFVINKYTKLTPTAPKPFKDSDYTRLWSAHRAYRTKDPPDPNDLDQFYETEWEQLMRPAGVGPGVLDGGAGSGSGVVVGGGVAGGAGGPPGGGLAGGAGGPPGGGLAGGR